MKSKILNVLSVIFGLMLVNGGLNKFFNYMPVPEDIAEEMIKDNNAILEIVWLMPLIGFAEVVGGILIVFPKMRALGALVIFPVMVGVLLSHIFVDPSGLPVAIIIWVTMSWIIYENREKYFPLLK